MAMHDYLNLAINIIDLSTKQKSHHITLITHRTTIVTIGVNKPFKSHVLAKRFGYRFDAIHSELDAIIRFSRSNKILRSCKVWNVRIDRNKQVRDSKPCNRCQQLLRAFGAQDIYYTINNGVDFEKL